jgi:gluconokinase
MSTAASRRSPDGITGAAVVMGVASCGKTTVGAAVADRLGVRFIEGDRLHSAANIAKMSAGTPLTDEDRWPWLASIGAALRGEDGAIAACSALKKSYRKAIAAAAGRPVSFVFLSGGRALLQQRINARKNHFMPPTLLDSQLATLEIPGPDEDAVTIDIAQEPEAIVEAAVAFLRGKTM